MKCSESLRHIAADTPGAVHGHKDESDEPNASQETEDERSDKLLLKELQAVYNWRKTLGKKIDNMVTVVVDRFISTSVDDDFFGSQ